MGSTSSTNWVSLEQHYEANKQKPSDGSDIQDLDSARAEIVGLRRIINEISVAAMASRQQQQAQTSYDEGETKMGTDAATLRIIHINDVYELDNLPKFATMVKDLSVGFDNVIVTLAGDFLGPSVLSALDSGKGMVDVLNAIPVTHVCFGNHENDVPFLQLLKRVKQFDGKWLNTNMPDFHTKLPRYDIIEIKSKDGKHVRKVGLCGLMLHTPTIHRKNAFGGAVDTMVPVMEAAINIAKELDDQCDVVIPLTHQDVDDDVLLSKAGLNFPVILGAHDHDFIVKGGEHGSSCLVVKVGSDAYKAAVIDVSWKDDISKECSVQMRFEDVGSYKKDMVVEMVAFNALKPVRDLKEAVMLRTSTMQELLSSRNIRTKQTTMGTLITSALRDGLNADCCFLNAGGIRGNSDYPQEFTYFDLRNEVAFTTHLVVCPMLGSVIAAAVKESRSSLPNASGSFFQLDSRCRVESDLNDGEEKKSSSTTDDITGMQTLVVINDEPIDMDKTYMVCTDYLLLTGMCNISPFVQYGVDHPEIIKNKDACVLSKPTLVQFFARNLVRAMGGIEDLDLNQDGVVSFAELKQCLKKLYADKNGDGVISEEEAVTAPGSVPDMVVDAVMKEVEKMQNQDGK
jgi:2',3'-cyclic-nucleotide 2'-phosphodiesterase (5'-nucleotidase family)